ncbi:helix-turn-helix domain-containing protein [Flavihumibacter sp. CACIAM 22H1]|uniref:IS1/IS1595 family N-terminal zinc-binding domain-containing protein n=1 Tax=Flavihumibacter sp. CACIAM 22H1 TaxID=1812911 RepID=UPI0007A84639|nr:helix-turn-helix domain-containing protein [Flavihumibacter sp. CACIAM 22H1]KYP15702.1 MAG: transposase [Flavihumibacter sp. CACIAM 22H1]
MTATSCPRCNTPKPIKSGIVKGKQRFHCKSCKYYFTVLKKGKSTDPYYVIKALQLYLEGVSLREIERLLGISHVSVYNWVKKAGIQAGWKFAYKPSYKVLTHTELTSFLSNRNNLLNTGCMITELGDKFMVIKWERFRKPD